MCDREAIMEEIKRLSMSATECTYNEKLRQGYQLLLKLHGLGVEQESVYQCLLQYLNGLEDSISYCYMLDILDYIVGWCSPQYCIWSSQ